MNPWNFPTRPDPKMLSGLQYPKLKTSTRLLAKQNLGVAKKLSLSTVLDSSNKAINAFNSFVPLYHEIKPLIQNTRSAVDGVKSFVAKRKTKKDEGKPTIKREKEVVEPEIVEGPKQKPIEEPLVDQQEPPTPFYG